MRGKWATRIPGLKTLLGWSVGHPEEKELTLPEAGPPPEPDAFISGNGGYKFLVVGESSHQAALEYIAGGRTRESASHPCFALLIPEPDNPYDPQAVYVSVDGYKVGHLTRDWAPKFKAALAASGYAQAACNALIVGGWDRGSGRKKRGYFGIKLDIALPLDFQSITPAKTV